MVFYSVLALTALVYGLYHYFTRTFNYWKERNVAGPQPVAFVGNLKESVFRRKTIGSVYKEIYDEYPNEKIVGVYRMTTPSLLIRDLDIIKHIMIKDFDLFVDRGVEFSKEGLGVNLFHADGDTWRVLRNKFTPLFTSGKLKNMLYLLTERGDKFVEYLDTECTINSEQEVHTLVQRYTMATISACAFGLDIDTLYDKQEDLKKIDKLVFTRNYSLELNMMYPGILKKLNSSILPAFVKTFFDELVSHVIAQRNGVPSNKKDFMDLLLELRQKGNVQGTMRNDEDKQLHLELTDDLITAQAFIFYVAGYETSATTMAFLLYLLALNTEVQDKLLVEIDAVLNKYDGQVTYDALNDMTYLDKVFDETLRLYPIVEPLQRNAQAEYKVPGTNVTINKGLTVVVSPMGVHYDEKYYPNPNKFDPERFAPENVRDRHPCAFMPFGTGPRNCIGMRFAKIQSRVCMVKMLSKFRVEPSKNTQRKMEFDPKRILMGPKGGIYLNFVKRK